MRYQALLVVRTLSELQAAGQFKQDQLAMTLGGDSVRDGKAAYYVWDEDDTSTDTSATTRDVVQVTGQTKGRWLLLVDEQANVTASTLAVSGLSSKGKRYTINAAAGCAVTLPAATGSGDVAEFVIGTTITSNSTTIAVTGDDIMVGQAIVAQDDASNVNIAFETAADSDTITFNGSTTGGIKGDLVRLVDIAADTWLVTIIMSATGTEATPFSAAVA